MYRIDGSLENKGRCFYYQFNINDFWKPPQELWDRSNVININSVDNFGIRS